MIIYNFVLFKSNPENEKRNAQTMNCLRTNLKASIVPAVLVSIKQRYTILLLLLWGKEPTLFFVVFFQYMKFIVQLVSIQHPVLIPKGALLNAHHPLSPPSHPPSTLNLFSVFKSLKRAHFVCALVAYTEKITSDSNNLIYFSSSSSKIKIFSFLYYLLLEW